MKTFFKIFFLFLLSLNLFASESSIDSITLTKIKKLVQKEEEIALAYKEYILEKGTNPSDLDDLITNNNLPKGFSEINPFGEVIGFDTSDSSKEYKLASSIPDNIDLKTNVFDYYYSDKYRVYTKAPLSINNSKVEIKLSSKEKFIYEKKDYISTTVTASKYYLDENAILHWYGSDGAYKFSINKDLIVDSSVDIFDTDGVTVLDDFKDMVSDVTFAGQTILHNNGTTADEYLGISDDSILKTSVAATVSTESGLLQISKQSGGMIVNGDIYTWGNNSNRITGIDLDSYTDEKGDEEDETPVITTLVKAKAKIYDDDSTDEKDLSNFYSQNYFSSPFRPRFIDLFTSIFHGICGITTEGALYCGGLTANDTDFIFTKVQTDGVSSPAEMMYRSTYFDGITNKAKKVFALNQLWLILAEDGFIYRWGIEDDYGNGFSGNTTDSFNNTISCEKTCIKTNKKGKCTKYSKEDTCINLEPEKITENITGVSFSDMTYIFGDGYKKIAALSDTKDIYIWGMDDENSEMKCTNVSGMNLCQATKIDSSTVVNTTTANLIEDLTFESIKGGVRAFIALASDGKYYKIDQAEKKKVEVVEIKNGTTSLPSDLLAIDLTKNGTVVYVNSANQLISTHFDSFDTTFKNTINSMLWKSVKVLDDENDAMCALNTDNQLYCWGIQSYYKLELGDIKTSTFMLPVFNTNLFDSKTDYLVAEAEDDKLTEMSSGTWEDDDTFYIKYPTYIGGFNYEVTFK
jgi:hypothetical protein